MSEKLTPAQKLEMENIQNHGDAIIVRGRKWYLLFGVRGSLSLDARVCNALVRKQVLIPIGENKYKLDLSAINHGNSHAEEPSTS